MKAAIAGAYTAKKKSGCWPVNRPNVEVIQSERKMNKPKMPQANPKAMSKKGMREKKLIVQLSVSDERFVIIVLGFVFDPANGKAHRKDTDNSSFSSTVVILNLLLSSK